MPSWASDDWEFMTLAAKTPWRLAPFQVLVVEDDLCLRPVILSTLLAQDPRTRVDWRTSVDEVLNDLNQDWRSLRAYDLIISDVYLPGHLSGIDLWRGCRFNCPTVQFVIMSAMKTSQYQKRMTGHGTHPDFLAKPFNPAQLSELVRKILEHQ